jgi:hypothetical protein
VFFSSVASMNKRKMNVCFEEQAKNKFLILRKTSEKISENIFEFFFSFPSPNPTALFLWQSSYFEQGSLGCR